MRGMVERASRGTPRGRGITGTLWAEIAPSRQPLCARTSHRLLTSVTPDTDKLVRQLSLVAYLMAERRSASARDVKQAVEGYSEMSDEAFARRFYADRSELLALGVPLQSQRDDFTGEELYTLLQEHYFLPGAQPQRRRARRALDRRAPAGRPVRLRRAAAPRAPEPRARPPQPLLRRRAGGDRAAAGQRLHRRGRRAAAEARDGHLEAAHRRLPLLGDLLRRGGHAHGRSLQPLPHERSLVRDRARPRPRRRAHLPPRPRARRRALRDPPRARLPRAAGVRPERLPQPRPVAARRRRRAGDDPGRARRRLAGRARRRPVRDDGAS